VALLSVRDSSVLRLLFRCQKTHVLSQDTDTKPASNTVSLTKSEMCRLGFLAQVEWLCYVQLLRTTAELPLCATQLTMTGVFHVTCFADVQLSNYSLTRVTCRWLVEESSIPLRFII